MRYEAFSVYGLCEKFNGADAELMSKVVYLPYGLQFSINEKSVTKHEVWLNLT